MSILCVILIVLSALVLLVWLSRHRMISAEKRQGFALSEAYDPPDGPATDWPLISVIVAAKDEEACIADCVRTMLDQDYPHFELLVANDRSSDRTPDIVSEIARTEPRLRLVNITSLPEGWCGKNNAMQTAIAQARGPWICMIDADCRQTSRASLRLAMQYALDQRADLLSVLPNLEMKGFWENVVQPVCGGMLMIWFHPDKVNSPRHPHAYANGAFMLIQRSAYLAVGTHEAVKYQVNEDMHMAARLKAAGLRLVVVRNHGLYLVRMYTSLRAICRGWGRIFYGTFGTLRRLSISLMVLVLMGLLPYATALLGLLALAAGAGPRGLVLATAIVGLAAAGMQISVIYRFYKLLGARKDLAWTYPIGCLVSVYALGIALSKLRKGSRLSWRNTTYVRPGA